MKDPADIELEARVKKTAEGLGEFFEAVQILCSRVKSGETQRVFRGVGNLYARQAMAREYSVRADAIEQWAVKEELDQEKEQ